MKYLSVRCSALMLGILSMASLNVHAVDEAQVQAITLKLNSIEPQLSVLSVDESPLPDIYQVVLSSGEQLFVTADAQHFVVGDLYEAGENGLVNISEEMRNDSRREMIADLDDKDKIIFKPETTKAIVTVFTDVDCSYCRKLHSQMDEYLALGIEVQYLAYPRAGIGSDSYDKIVTAWCSDDRQAALTKLKSGDTLSAITCDNPVASEFLLGNKVGVTGTPAIVTAAGELVPGYVPPAQLANYLGL